MPTQKPELLIGVLITTFVFLIIGFFVLILIAFIHKRKIKHIEEKQEMRFRFNQELMQTQLEIQEQTLKRISQEIHDNVGQILTLAKINLNLPGIELEEAVQLKIDHSRELVATAIRDLRDLAKTMNTDYVSEVGLPQALNQQILSINRTGEFQGVFILEGEPVSFDRNINLILFRIIQELLNNAIKHSGASVIKIALRFEKDLMTLEVSDDGKGFDMSVMEINNKGIGLRNLKSRAGLIGAELMIDTTIDTGTSTTIVLKYQ